MRWQPSIGPFAAEAVRGIHGSGDGREAQALYRTMLTIRLAEERIADIYPSDKIQSPIHLCIGQEAIATGVCGTLKPTDRVYGTYRGHGLYIAKGGKLGGLFAELYGKATGCAKGKGGSMHLVAPEVGLMGCSAIVGSLVPVAVGDALASEMQGRPRVIAAVFGDGAVDEGVFFESLNFAALKQLPIVFVCENNAYAIHSRVADRHRQTELFRYGESLGVPGERCDGNDVFGVLATMQQAVETVRQGGPPRLIEFMTYRWPEHVGPNIDHAEAYRDHNEIKRAKQFDPLRCAELRLRERWRIADDWFDRCEEEVLEEIRGAVEFAEQSPFPDPSSLFENLFEEATP